VRLACRSFASAAPPTAAAGSNDTIAAAVELQAEYGEWLDFSRD
jgi:hypothetical protein